jgi:hypothetical protein
MCHLVKKIRKYHFHKSYISYYVAFLFITLSTIYWKYLPSRNSIYWKTSIYWQLTATATKHKILVTTQLQQNGVTVSRLSKAVKGRADDLIYFSGNFRLWFFVDTLSKLKE